MRIATVLLLFASFCAGLSATPASAATAKETETFSVSLALRWINGFRHSPDVKQVPVLIKTLSRNDVIKDPESSGVYLGFLAGVLRSHPLEARSIAAAILPLPYEHQWLLIKALAYSDVPGWKNILRELAPRLSERQPLIERYLTGKLPTIATAKLEREGDSTWDKVRYFVGYQKPQLPPLLTYDTNPDLIDTLWGFYFATGDSGPIIQLIELMPWSRDRDSAEKLTIGSMAKFTLASNASRDSTLLLLLKRLKAGQTPLRLAMLNEVIEASENVETGRLRKEAVAAIDELRLKGPGSRRDMAMWGTVGEAGISLGCLGAAVAGATALGLPCVVGGALSSAGLRYLASPN